MPRAAFTYLTEPSAPIPGIILGAGGGCGATVGLTSPVVHTFPVGSAWQYVLLTNGTGFDRPSLAPLHMKHCENWLWNHATHPSEGTPGTGIGFAALLAQQSASHSADVLAFTIVSMQPRRAPVSCVDLHSSAAAPGTTPERNITTALKARPRAKTPTVRVLSL